MPTAVAAEDAGAEEGAAVEIEVGRGDFGGGDGV